MKFKHVPYQGGAPAIQAVLAGQIDFTVAVSEEIRGRSMPGPCGSLGSPQRSEMRAILTLRPCGKLDTGILVENMKGWVGPKDLPEDIVKFHHDCFQKAMSSKPWQEYRSN